MDNKEIISVLDMVGKTLGVEVDGFASEAGRNYSVAMGFSVSMQKVSELGAFQALGFELGDFINKIKKGEWYQGELKNFGELIKKKDQQIKELSEIVERLTPYFNHYEVQMKLNHGARHDT